MRAVLAAPALILLASLVGFGALARETGLSLGQAMFMTAAIWALPSQVVPNAASNSAVVVRSIKTPSQGTYLAVVNTAVQQVDDVAITPPVSGTVTDAVTKAVVPLVNGKLVLSMYPAQLRSFVVVP